ncbi:MAG TPA: antibiotic biosynthesis monooxygenase [Bacteroidia bacterium]|jgi:quinol monooxygenase YgiN|nr:antibiotic biosynthesis monooxygenase [Bacteroidota bacterium]MBP9790161.1 antibiotic biosynthesis monooxygenase [Bacteroidia bacterium]MBK7432272.1 antibiotic biosynthesis monooxygenase [Bacteroidota bacterium]MBK8584347.1 antibiotic biosynthesis monooxygenase [Bacteroidota bacterium]MBP9922956.1 antibiotic biosynthesis monooxygenase [Bacteroidia bacterium]
MIKYALLTTLMAKSGKEDEVEEFLKTTLSLVESETNTITWYAFKMGANKFGIFNTFPNDTARKAHLAGEVAKALINRSPHLFSLDPQIQQLDVVAVKETELKFSF